MIDSGALSKLHYGYWSDKIKIFGGSYHLLKGSESDPTSLFLEIQGQHHRLGFQPSKEILFYADTNISDISFTEQVSSIDDEVMKRVRSALEDKLSKMPKQDVKAYEQIFEKPRVECRDIQYPDRLDHPDYDLRPLHVVSVLASLKTVLRGEEGGLSTAMFDLFRRFCMVPAYNTCLSLPRSTST